jgi:hypothetical protein
MTPRQIELARHALGLRPSCLVSHRNRFLAGPGHPDYADWQAMVAAGQAKRLESEYLPPGDVLFHLTRAGAELALLPGDKLDPEVWS